MADKHTRGPWRIFRDGASNDTAYVRTEAEFGAGEIAVLYSQPNEADALLIAAAPELLEVALGLEADCSEDEFGWGDIRISKENLEQLRAAIRKARGESQ